MIPQITLINRLLTVIVLAIGMLLVSTVELKASWLWVLAPIALLLTLEVTAKNGGGFNFSGLPFYGTVLAVALSFHFFGLPSTGGTRTVASAGGCGSCGTTGGCGSGGCGASSGGSCGCGSGSSATATKKVATATASRPAASTLPARTMPVSTVAPNRNMNVQLPPLPVRPAGSAVTGPVPVTRPTGGPVLSKPSSPTPTAAPTTGSNGTPAAPTSVSPLPKQAPSPQPTTPGPATPAPAPAS